MASTVGQSCPQCDSSLDVYKDDNARVFGACARCGITFRWMFGRGWTKPEDVPVPHADTPGNALAFELKTVRASIRREWRGRAPNWLELGLRSFLSTPRWIDSGLRLEPEDDRSVTILDRDQTPRVRAMLDVDDQIQLIPVD